MNLQRLASPRHLAALLGLLLCSLAVTGCDSLTPSDDMAMLPENQRVSQIPFNKPESWEGRGQLGALADNPRITGGQ